VKAMRKDFIWCLSTDAAHFITSDREERAGAGGAGQLGRDS